MLFLLIVNSSEEFYRLCFDIAFCAVEYKTIWLCGFHRAKVSFYLVPFHFFPNTTTSSEIPMVLWHFSSNWSSLCRNTSWLITSSNNILMKSYLPNGLLKHVRVYLSSSSSMMLRHWVWEYSVRPGIPPTCHA